MCVTVNIHTCCEESQSDGQAFRWGNGCAEFSSLLQYDGFYHLQQPVKNIRVHPREVGKRCPHQFP